MNRKQTLLYSIVILCLLSSSGVAMADGFSTTHDWTVVFLGEPIGIRERALLSDFDGTVYTRIFFAGKILQLPWRLEIVVGVPALFLLAALGVLIARNRRIGRERPSAALSASVDETDA